MLSKIDELVSKLEKYSINIGSENFKIFLIKDKLLFPEFKRSTAEYYFKELEEFYSKNGEVIDSIILEFKNNVYYIIKDINHNFFGIIAPLELLSIYSPENYIRIKRCKEYKRDLIYY